MDFIKEVYYGNALWLWGAAAGLSVVAFIFFLILKRVVANRFEAFAKKTKTDIDDLVAKLLHKTSTLSLLILSIYVGAQLLRLPPAALKIMRTVTVLAVLLQAAIWRQISLRSTKVAATPKMTMAAAMLR